MTKVKKRNGDIVGFDENKIVVAVSKAMNEAEEFKEDIAIEIADEVKAVAECSNKEFIEIDEIQDLIEGLLIEHGLKKTSKLYILFRAERDRERDKKRKYKYLSSEFLSKYKHLPNPFPENLGEFVYYRTYSRWLPEEKRREYWWETVARSVDYNCSLGNTTIKEAELLFDNIYNLRQFLSGRTTYVGGTKVTETSGLANFNCAGVVLDEYEKLSELFLLLMLGTGVGFRVLQSDVDKLPKIRTDVEIFNKEYSPVNKTERKEHTEIEFKNNIAKITVGDSRFGWSEALRLYFRILTESHYSDVNYIIINYDNVRSVGEPLKTFGGFSSGNKPLETMFTKISGVILKHKDMKKIKLRPIDIMDIAGVIAQNVVSGGVRRSSLVCMFDSSDKELYTAKQNLYSFENGEWKINKDLIHRSMSNNSIYFYQEPTLDEIKQILKEARFNGEPAWLFAYNALKRKPNFKLTNPCVEILLDDRGNCNLTTVNVMAFVENGILNYDKLLEAQKLSARASYRMTNVDLELHKWNIVHKRDRLTGCSMTGIIDMFNATNMSEDEQVEFYKIMHDTAHKAVEEIANEQNTHKPDTVCTLKPEGSLSQLPTVSSGIHASHSQYYIRRVRINAHDPLVKVCKELGWEIKPEVGQTMDNADTFVFEFPVKSPEGKTKYQQTALEQLENYKKTMLYYTDFNTSITVHVRDNEWDDVANWVNNNKDWIVAISFLPLDDSMYQLLPYEEISEEVYKEMKSKMVRFNPSLISKYESSYQEFDVNDDSCSTGACPIR